MASSEPPKLPAKPKPSGRKSRKLSQKEQSERFIETARTLQSDESGTPFERAMRVVIPLKHSSK
jgi:hypothetical protein